ncbi:arsR family transcriptional regulator [Planomonospora sphaerica]|uniref:ArsR family transcriptional regulator n=1 Tax=Planomonospora sphaerica TaxID=161355 RepID=A0A161LN65_9ACTN|nr:arsR family transcriptional regulator [Planomonospora sphaerica]
MTAPASAGIQGPGGAAVRAEPVRTSARDRGRRQCHGREGAAVSAPLYQLKAEFFKTLGHPSRIRVLELLSEREHSVAEMLPEVGIEPAHLSQQLAVLRRANLVTARKEGSTVYYSLTHPGLADLLAVARSILTGVLSGQAELLEDLRASARERG